MPNDDQEPSAWSISKDSDKARNRWLELTNWVAVAAALTGVVVGIMTLRFDDPHVSATDKRLIEQLTRFQNAVLELSEEATNSAMRFHALLSITNITPADVQLVAMKGELASMNKRLTELEGAILESPTKALSVPMLRQDFENLRVANQKDFDSVSRQIDRVYDQNKWFLGLMFTMAVGLIGLAVSNLIQTKKKEK